MNKELSYGNAYPQFKIEFKEDAGFFEKKENETGIDNTDGAHLQFGMVVVPYLYHLADISDEEKIKKCFAFFEKMSKSSDSELNTVVQFSVLEDIVGNKKYYDKLKCYFTDEMNSYLPHLHSYIDF